MKYERIIEGTFIERPNRFLAKVEINGNEEIVHVKNTGRCKELLIPGTKIWLQDSDNPQRKTRYDLIAVQKGRKIINMDSQIPNKVVKEWIESGNLFSHVDKIRPETTYGGSRFDLYVEADGKKIFIEVKGVTLEEDGIVKFPDAPSERAVKHVEELCEAKKDGYEVYVFFVIQLSKVRYFTPNSKTHAKFAEALQKASEAGVHVLAYDCKVTKNSIEIANSVPVIFADPVLKEIAEPLVKWYRNNKRDLPWRKHINAYRVWLSEIMLQQTRVEAVKPFYKRFLAELPDVVALAYVEEDKLLKLWEGLGYYNRVRNMQKAALQVMEEYEGEFPRTYEGIRSLTGIGSYTAGAIGSFAFGIPKPAVDGNVLRVIQRVTANADDIMKASVKERMEEQLEQVIPTDAASDFNQGLIELGAIICVPNGAPKCEICPLAHLCKAKEQNLQSVLPVKAKAKDRKIEDRTVFLFRDGEMAAIKKRPGKGLLAGLYEFPNVLGHLSMEEAVAYAKKIGLAPIKVKELAPAKHIFSHVEWRMKGYLVQVDELEKSCKEEMLFIHPEDVEREYPIPAAFGGFTEYLNIKLGQDKYD